MSYVRELFARVRGLFTGSRSDGELSEELQAHLDMEIAEYTRRGMTPDEARRKALLASGGVTQGAEAVRDQRGLPWIESAVADIRYAVRALRHSPAFTIIAVITLALGIGANTAIFSVVRGVLLKPLPHRDGDRLIYLRHAMDGGANLTFSVPEVRDFREGAKSFVSIAEYSPFSGILVEDNTGITLQTALVTGNFFEVMGLSPIAGRLTRPSDDGKGVPPVMVLTHDFWKKHYGGDTSIVGKQVKLDGKSVTVIGIVQPAPWFPNRIDVLMNMVVSPHHLSAQMTENRSHRMTEMIGRLSPGATVEQAQKEVAAVTARAHNDYKQFYDAASHYTVTASPFHDAIGERARLTLWLLMAAAAFVMIIAAANVVNLTLMRGVRREHELVVRAALGAGVSRLRRLLLAENLVLTLTGAAGGVFLATAGVGLLTSLAARYSPRASEISLDGTVLGFTLALSVALALLLSFVAALPKEGRFAAWISAGGRRASSGSRKQRLQRGLVVAQIAVSVVLLAGAGLLTRTMIQLSDVNTGLKAEEVLTMEVSLLSPGQLVAGGDANAKVVYENIRREISALPGVTEAGLGSIVPLRSSGMRFEIVAEGKPPVPGEAVPRAEFRSANPEYFRASGIPLLAGREFATTDNAASAKVLIVNKTFADKFFPNENAVGKRVAFSGEILKFTPFTGEWRTIVGVVGNTQDGGLDAKPRMAVFTPFVQEIALAGGFVIRTDSNAKALVAPATQIIRRLAPAVPIENVLTVKQIKDLSVSPRRLNAMLLSSFGVLALLIAAVGIAGVLAFSVSARTNEIGIRMSLGADRAQVQWMVLKEGAVLLVIGLALGVGGALAASGAIRGLLFGVAPRDPLTFVGVSLMMAAIGIVACWIPAIRASRVDPAVAMRA